MAGRLQDAWQFVFSEIWAPLEDTGEMPLHIYAELYAELVKALRKAPQRTRFDNIAAEPELARETIKNASAGDLPGENSIARFFENAFDVYPNPDTSGAIPNCWGLCEVKQARRRSFPPTNR